jgi:hypothetical protein
MMEEEMWREKKMKREKRREKEEKRRRNQEEKKGLNKHAKIRERLRCLWLPGQRKDGLGMKGNRRYSPEQEKSSHTEERKERRVGVHRGGVWWR